MEQKRSFGALLFTISNIVFSTLSALYFKNPIIGVSVLVIGFLMLIVLHKKGILK